jgi:aspartyl-tRNA synthetase
MPVTEAQRRATSKYIAKNHVEERARHQAYYYANKEVIAQKQKERHQRKKAELASIKAELKKKEDDQRKMVTDILTRHRQAIHDELLQTYKTQGMPAWIVDAICVDMTQLYGLDYPRPLGKDPRLTPEDPVIVPPSPIPDSV